MNTKVTNPICPNCGEKHTTKSGYRLSVTHGRKQRFQCTKCFKTFYAPEEDKSPCADKQKE